MKLAKTISVVLGGLLGVIYLLNPGAGVIELIPDNIPVVGNLDEAAATVLIINTIVHFRRQRRRKFVEPEDPANE